MIMLILAVMCPKNALSFCFELAGQTYGIPHQLIQAIACQESDFNSKEIRRNRNGSFDFGVMQINSWWFDTLRAKRWPALSDSCFNVMAGTWILRDCIDSFGYTWDCLACYRSGRPLSALSDPVKRMSCATLNI
jgi:soluble lytic murein transglycosylase-like protein